MAMGLERAEASHSPRVLFVRMNANLPELHSRQDIFPDALSKCRRDRHSWERNRSKVRLLTSRSFSFEKSEVFYCLLLDRA